MTVYYEVKITGPDCERTEIYYALEKAKVAYSALVEIHSLAHTVDLRRFEVDLMSSFDGENESIAAWVTA